MNKLTSWFGYLIAAFALCACAFEAGAFAPVSPPGLDHSELLADFAPAADSAQPVCLAVTWTAAIDVAHAQQTVGTAQPGVQAAQVFARPKARMRERPSVAPYARQSHPKTAPPPLII